MVSYEKVRRSLRTATITIIVLNSLSLVFRLFTGISVQLAKTEINKGNTGNPYRSSLERHNTIYAICHCFNSISQHCHCYFLY